MLWHAIGREESTSFRIPRDFVFKPFLNGLQCKSIQNPDTGSIFHSRLLFVEILVTSKHFYSKGKVGPTHDLQFAASLKQDAFSCVIMLLLTRPKRTTWSTGDRQPKRRAAVLSGRHQVISLSQLSAWATQQGKTPIHLSSISTPRQMLLMSLCSLSASTPLIHWANSAYWSQTERKQTQQKSRGASSQCHICNCISFENKETIFGTAGK